MALEKLGRMLAGTDDMDEYGKMFLLKNLAQSGMQMPFYSALLARSKRKEPFPSFSFGPSRAGSVDIPRFVESKGDPLKGIVDLTGRY